MRLQKFKHIKRGSTYVVAGEGTVQISTDLKDGDRVVIYASLEDRALYVRKYDEFYDETRFERVSSDDCT